MRKEAKNFQTALRMDSKLKKLVDSRIEEHGAASISDYLRGLMWMDILLSYGEADLKDIPSWLLSAYPLSYLEEVRKRLGKHKVLSLIESGKINLGKKSPADSGGENPSQIKKPQSRNR